MRREDDPDAPGEPSAHAEAGAMLLAEGLEIWRAFYRAILTKK